MSAVSCPAGARPPDTTTALGSACFTAGYAAFSSAVYEAGSGPVCQKNRKLGSFQISQSDTEPLYRFTVVVMKFCQAAMSPGGHLSESAQLALRAHGGVKSSSPRIVKPRALAAA